MQEHSSHACIAFCIARTPQLCDRACSEWGRWPKDNQKASAWSAIVLVLRRDDCRPSRQKTLSVQRRASACACDQEVSVRTNVCSKMQDTSPGSADGPLLEESRRFLTQACMRVYKGKNTSHPDIKLKLGDKMLPAHRALLAESSDVLKAMFQASVADCYRLIPCMSLTVQ